MFADRVTADAAAIDLQTEFCANNYEKLRGLRRGTLNSFVCSYLTSLLATWLIANVRHDRERVMGAAEVCFRPLIERRIHARLRDQRWEWDDAFNTVFLGLFQTDAEGLTKLEKFREVGSFAGYISVVCDHLLVDFIRAKAKAARREVALPETAGPNELAAVGPLPDEQLIAPEEEDAQERLVGTLMNILEGFSGLEKLCARMMLEEPEPDPAEIARRLGRPVAHVYKARWRIRKVLEEARVRFEREENAGTGVLKSRSKTL